MLALFILGEKLSFIKELWCILAINSGRVAIIMEKNSCLWHAEVSGLYVLDFKRCVTMDYVWFPWVWQSCWGVTSKVHCCDFSFRFAIKAKVYKGADWKWSLGVTFHVPKSAGECEGMNSHAPK
jgi:hypothetical protein